MELNDNQYTLIGIIIGGAGLKLVDYFAQRRKTRDDELAQLRRDLDSKDDKARDELREELKELRDRLDDLSRELDEWKEKYWTKVQELNNAQAENARLLLESVRNSTVAKDN